MNVQAIALWVGPLLDVAVLAAVGVVLWQLRRDPSAAWSAQEARLRELHEGLRLLVVQAEGEARELDRRLAAHAQQLTTSGDAASVASPARRKAASPGKAASPSDPAPAPASLAERVQQLAAARTPIAEIARRLSLPVAEARVLAGLTTGAAAYLGAGRGEEHAA
jgi:hypothetical protein